MLTEVQEFLNQKNKGAFINGKFHNEGEGKNIPVINPATEELLTEVDNCDKQVVNEAVQAAYNELENGKWSKLLPNQKEKLLLRYADIIENNGDELAELLVLEHGKLLSDAKKEVSAAVNCFRYYAGWATKIEGSTIDVSLSGGPHFAYTKREPIGVVGAIAPWNVPIMMYAWNLWLHHSFQTIRRNPFNRFAISRIIKRSRYSGWRDKHSNGNRTRNRSGNYQSSLSFKNYLYRLF